GEDHGAAGGPRRERELADFETVDGGESGPASRGLGREWLHEIHDEHDRHGDALGQTGGVRVAHGAKLIDTRLPSRQKGRPRTASYPIRSSLTARLMIAVHFAR